MPHSQQQQQRSSVWSTRSITSSATASSSLRLPAAARSHGQHSGSSSAWVSYSTLRAETLVYNSLAHRRSLQTTATLQREVSCLPSSPRRPFLDCKQTSAAQSTILPALWQHEDGGKEAQDCDAVISHSAALHQEEKEQTLKTEAERQSEAGEAEQSREAAKQQEQEQEQEQQQEQQQEQSRHPLDVLDSFISSHPPSARLALLQQRRSGRHAAALAAFSLWQQQHKEQTALQLRTLCSAFNTAQRSRTAAPQEKEAQRSIDDFTQRLQQLSSGSLQTVNARLQELVSELLDIGLVQAEGVQSLLSETVQRWNVWTVRNSRAVQELQWRLTAQAWQQQQQQQSQQPAQQQTV